MKKLFILVLLILTTINATAQEVIVNEKTITETERIVDKYGSKLAESFSKAMDTATPIAQQGFETVVNLQIAKGVAYLLVVPFFFIFWHIFLKYYKKAHNGNERFWADSEGGTVAVISLVFSCALTIAMIPALYHGILHIIAPEWFAIKEITELF